MNDSMQKKRIAEMASNLAAELSADQMREVAAQLMARANQADGLQMHTVMHRHKFGESFYYCLAKPGLAVDEDSEVEFAQAIGINLEPHRDEFISITPMEPRELSSPPIYTCGEQDVESGSNPRPQG